MTEQYLELTTRLVEAYVSHNQVPPADLPSVIKTIHAAVSGSTVAPAPERPAPAVAISKSITPEHIVCLEDGKRLVSMKRYLRRKFGLTPIAYRTRWGLPPDYPMVAPNYSAIRSQFAKDGGLGRKVAP